MQSASCRNRIQEWYGSGSWLYALSLSSLLCIVIEVVDLDAVVDVDHGEEGLRLEEALVVPIFKGLEEDF